MTVADVTRKAGPYEFTSGGTYPFYFHVFTETDVYIVVADEDENETELVYGTDYTVTINDDQDNDPGGIVKLNGDWTGYTVTIGSCVPYTQEVVITNKGGFYPNTLNDTFDKLTTEIQQNREIIDRCLKVGIASSSSAEEYKADLEALVDESVASAAAAAESAAAASKDANQAANDAANALQQAGNAVDTSNEALSQANSAVNTANSANATANTAMEQSTAAVNTANEAAAQSEGATSTANEAIEIAKEALETANTADENASSAVDTTNDALNAIPQEVQDAIDALNIDQLVYDEVMKALEGVTIPGLTYETIVAALGYVPLDENNLNTITEEEIDALPIGGLVNADQVDAVAIVQEIADAADKAIETIEDYVKNNIEETFDAKLEEVETKVTEIETKVTEVEESLDTKIADVESSLDSKLAEAESELETKITEVASSAVPSGTVIYFAGTSTPSGYLLCDGSAVSRTTYADLYSAIGTRYGSGDGSTTFAIPSMSNRFVKANSTPGTTASAGLPNISGTHNTYGNVGSTGGNCNSGCFGTGSTMERQVSTASGTTCGDATSFYASYSNSIYGASSTVEPPSITLRACIKY